MQAIILSAGRGQRLAPLTDTLPKPLVTVLGKPIIEYQLLKLASLGVKKVVVNTGWLGQQLIEYLGTGKQYGLRIVYSIEPQIALETGGGIFQALPLIESESFIVCNADIYHEFELGHLLDYDLAKSKVEALLFLVDNPEHNLKGDFLLNSEGLVMPPDEHVLLDTCTYSGMGFYRKSFFSDSMPGRYGLGKMLKAKCIEGKIAGEKMQNAWFDAGTRERIQQIEQHLS